MAGLFDHDVACIAYPEGVVLLSDFLEGVEEDGGAFVLYCIGNPERGVLFHACRGRAGARHKAGDVAYRRAGFFEQPHRFCEIVVGFAGETDDDVRAEREA